MLSSQYTPSFPSLRERPVAAPWNLGKILRETAVTEFLPFKLDAENQCLWREGKRVTLTPKAFSVLLYLVDRAGRLVAQNELLDALWPGIYVQPEVLKTHILEIRSALGDDARNPSFIETQPKRGYRFIAIVSNGSDAERASGDSSAARKPVPAASIAVLPFADLSGDKSDEYFSDGLTEEIINALAKVRGLKVIARTSAFAFKGRNEDIRRIAEALGVANVLEGSVRRSGNRVRITAQLIDASDGAHLWSDRYDREITDIFAVQDELAAAIAEALHAKLGVPYQSSAKPPANPEAYQAYLEGRYYMHQITPKGMERAHECYQRAIRLDPGYALPHVGLAERAYYQAIYLEGRPREIVPAALARLARALQLDPMLAEAHVVRGIFSSFYEYDWKASSEHFARALEMDPMSGRARSSHSLWHLLPVGRLEEALDEVKRAVQLDPLNPASRNPETWMLAVMRKEKAIERARSALQLFSSRWIGNWVGSHAFIWWGLYEEAVGALEGGLDVVPDNTHLLGALALARGRQGKLDEAQRIRAELEERSRRQYVPFFARAYASEACGDVDFAYQLLNQAMEEREPLVVPVLGGRKALGDTDPRLQALLQKMNLA